MGKGNWKFYIPEFLTVVLIFWDKRGVGRKIECRVPRFETAADVIF